MVLVILQNNVMNNIWIFKLFILRYSHCIYPDSTSSQDLGPAQPIVLSPQDGTQEYVLEHNHDVCERTMERICPTAGRWDAVLDLQDM